MEEQPQPQQSSLDANLSELRRQSVTVVSLLAGSIGYVLTMVVFITMANDGAFAPPVFGSGLLLLAGAIVGYAFRRSRSYVAGYVVVGSGLVAVVILQLMVGGTYVAYGFVIPIIFASVLFAPPLLIGLSLFVSLFIIGHSAALAGAPELSPPVLVPVGVVMAVAVGSWLSSSHLRTALAWVWTSYEQSRRNQEELRRNQGELARTLKALDSATSRLERLNYSLAVARDQAEEARRLKQQFAQNISHELRTPLNLVVEFVKLMAHSPEYYGAPLDPSYVRDLGVVYRNATHLQELVDDILDLARIEAAQMGLAPEAVSPARLVNETADTVRTLVRAHSLSLDVKVDPSLPLLWMDPLRIRQVILNLISNAVRSTDHGGITLAVERHENEVVFSVEDTGVGIPLESQERIFREFEQVEGRSRGGAGLGLAISREFVRMHGGRIWVESQEGVGSTFYFALPIERAVATDEPTQRAGGFDARVGPRPNKSVDPILLLVTPDPSAATLLKRHLRGVRVFVAPNLVQAARAAIRLFPQAVLIDQSLGLGSKSLARFGSEWGLGHVPIIMSPMPGTEMAAQPLQANGYMAKPVSRDDVFDTLRELEAGVERILIIDDDLDFGLYMSRLLEGNAVRRYRVSVANSGSEGLELLELLKVDAVMVDIGLPDMDGYEIIRRIRARSAWRDLPIIIVSGQDEYSAAEIVPGEIVLSRVDGLSPRDVVAWVQGVLDVTIKDLEAAPVSLSAPVQTPALAKTPMLPETEPDPSA